MISKKRLKFYSVNLFFLLATVGLAPLFYLNIFFEKKRKKAAPRILLIESYQIGDAVCTTSVFRELRKKFPSAFLVVLAAEPGFGALSANPRLDLAVRYQKNSAVSFFKALFKLKKHHFSHSISFFPSVFSNLLPFWLGIPNRIGTKIIEERRDHGFVFNWTARFLNFSKTYGRGEYAPTHHLKLLEFFGIGDAFDSREVFSPPSSKEKIKTLFKLLGAERLKIISIAPGSGKEIRKWPAEKFIKLIKKINQKESGRAFFLLIGSVSEKEELEFIKNGTGLENIKNLAGYFEVADLASFFERVDLFISVDSGPLYIADAAGTATVDILGPSDPRTQSPNGKSVLVKTAQNVKPCSYVMYLVNCHKDNLAKLMDISVDQVLEACELLKQKG